MTIHRNVINSIVVCIKIYCSTKGIKYDDMIEACYRISKEGNDGSEQNYR